MWDMNEKQVVWSGITEYEIHIFLINSSQQGDSATKMPGDTGSERR